MSKTTVVCGVCGYSAPRRGKGRIGRHYLYSGLDQYLCMGSGKLAKATLQPPLLGSRLKEEVVGGGYLDPTK